MADVLPLEEDVLRSEVGPVCELKQLQKEDMRLKRLMAELSLYKVTRWQ